MNILVISPFAPYKNVSHAGGKIHTYYLEKLIEKGNHLTLVSAIESKNINKYQTQKIINNSYLYEMKDNPSFRQKIKGLNPLNRYAGLLRVEYVEFVRNTVLQLKKNKYIPDLIIYDWTEASLMSLWIKKIFRDVPFICVEQDVTFQRFDRVRKGKMNILKKIFNNVRYAVIRRNELKCLGAAKEILVLNNKDKALLLKYNKNLNEKIRVISPYFDKYFQSARKNITNRIIFYGAMNRFENIDAVVWFIENVMNSLPEDMELVVLGSNPTEKIKSYESKRIHITGFVEDVSVYFKDAFCMVVPLQFGAGIKIKVLEAMSAGITVLTNAIGIEGIDAEKDRHYMHCETKDDYIKSILMLREDVEKNLEIGINAKKYILENYNYENEDYVL